MFKPDDFLVLSVYAVMLLSMCPLFGGQRENAFGNAPTLYIIGIIANVNPIIAIPRPEPQTGKENRKEQRGKRRPKDSLLLSLLISLNNRIRSDFQHPCNCFQPGDFCPFARV